MLSQKLKRKLADSTQTQEKIQKQQCLSTKWKQFQDSRCESNLPCGNMKYRGFGGYCVSCAKSCYGLDLYVKTSQKASRKGKAYMDKVFQIVTIMDQMIEDNSIIDNQDGDIEQKQPKTPPPTPSPIADDSQNDISQLFEETFEIFDKELID
jgi:hypothetical protein